jgi:hypothetical protein
MTIDAVALGHFGSRSTSMQCARTGMYLHFFSTGVQLTLLMTSPYDPHVAGANTSEMGSIGRCLRECTFVNAVYQYVEYGYWFSRGKEPRRLAYANGM